MQLALFEAGQGTTPNANGSGRSLKRTSARRRWPAQHELRRKDVGEVLSEPGLSFRIIDGVEARPAGRVPTPVPRSNAKPAATVPGAVAITACSGLEVVEGSTLAETPHPTRGKTLAPEVLMEGEVKALIGACSKRAITGIRNKALLAVLWRTGIRISEALDLMPYDIDFERGTLRVRLGKGLKPRTTVFNDTDCVPLLRGWLQLRREAAPMGDGGRLFCTLAGTSISTSYIRHLMPRLACRASIVRRVHAHALRHTHAADLAIAGVPVLAIQRQLGHASLSTTSEYLKRVGVRLNMVDAIRRSEPDAGTPALSFPGRRAPIW